MTQSYYVPQSRLIHPPITKHEVQTAEKTNPDVESLFFENVNRSFLAKMSDNNTLTMKK